VAHLAATRARTPHRRTARREIAPLDLTDEALGGRGAGIVAVLLDDVGERSALLELRVRFERAQGTRPSRVPRRGPAGAFFRALTI